MTLAQFGTLSKNPQMWGFESYLYVIGAHDCYLQLWDGKEYIDWVSGLGTSLFGYWGKVAESPIANALVCAPSLPTTLEVQVAERLCQMLGNHVPSWSSDDISCRFAKTGTEVTTMAVRLARAITSDDYIITFQSCYHGWADWSISRTSPALGIPVNGNYVLESEWGNIEQLEQLLNQFLVAGVIFEVPAFEVEKRWYQDLRRLCTEHNVLLIVDEIVTGLRYGLGGACERYGIEPDLVCLGKAMGNGMPISALIGYRDHMEWFDLDSPVFCSSTTWGDNLSLAAAGYVLTHWNKDYVNYIWDVGERLIEGLREAGWDVFGHGARIVLQFENEYERAFFIQGMRKHGVLMNRPQFPTLAHSDGELEHTINAAKEIRASREKLDDEVLGILMQDCLPRVLFRER